MRILSGPIPGQSLTKKPGNYPWDKPSKFNNVDLVETYLTSKVSEGMHSIDVSILVAPVLHEFLYNLAKDSGIDFKEFPDEKVIGTKEKALSLLKAELKSTPEEEQDSGFELLEGMATTLKDQVKESPAKQEEETKPSKGLMSRST